MQTAAVSSVSKNIAVIGAGISGLFCAYLLSRHHKVTVFEAEAGIGGHTATRTVTVDGKHYDVDTGFIVFNDRTYPNFIKLMSRLGVVSQPTEMGFSVSCQATDFEYSGTSLNGVFAQRRNLLNPDHWRMLQEILRFNRECIRLHETGGIEPDKTLGDFLRAEGYSKFFQHYYILPMVSAIWSSGLDIASAMPLLFFIRFFHNHGLLTVMQQPQWYTIKGGSKTYLGPLTSAFKGAIHVSTPVQWVKRHEDGVTLFTSAHGQQHFDEVIFACHSDQAHAVLLDPTTEETTILGAIPYKVNDVCLHTDTRLLPATQRAWASWNYLLLNRAGADAAALTYNMNILQRIESNTTFCVSVNANAVINPEKILGQYRYSHPVFTTTSVAAQQRWAEISGKNHTHYCGAYWRNGFHEDGVVSALNVARMLGEEW